MIRLIHTDEELQQIVEDALHSYDKEFTNIEHFENALRGFRLDGITQVSTKCTDGSKYIKALVTFDADENITDIVLEFENGYHIVFIPPKGFTSVPMFTRSHA